jgi:hypothetical protein
MLCKDIPAGLVIAVHEHYLGLDGYKEARSLLSAEMWVPRLSSPSAGIERILEHRLANSGVTDPLGDVILAGGVARLAQHYEADAPIRDVLRVSQRALQHALSSGVGEIGPQLVELAIAELTPRIA